MVGAILLAACGDPASRDPASSDPVDEQRTGVERLADQLLEASVDVPIVCLGELHGSTADAELRSALLTHPEFAGRFGRVLFEGASAAQQGLLDRFVLEGVELDPEELTPIWRDAGRGLQWRLPLYRRLFDEVRALNDELPRAQRVQLLGGAPPIRWGDLRSPEELAPWVDRDAWLHEQMRDLVGQERSTLAVYGRHHCERLRFADDPELRPALLSVLSVGPAEDVQFRRRVGVEGAEAVLVPIDAQRAARLVRDTWGEGHLYRGSRFGEVADLVLSYGDLEHRILVMHEDDLRPDELEELHRRDEWMAAALAHSAKADR